MKDESKKSSHDRIELRSAKVREILDSRLSRWVRVGTIMVSVIFLLLAIIVLSLDYPYGNGETIFQHIFCH